MKWAKHQLDLCNELTGDSNSQQKPSWLEIRHRGRRSKARQPHQGAARRHLRYSLLVSKSRFSTQSWAEKKNRGQLKSTKSLCFKGNLFWRAANRHQAKVSWVGETGGGKAVSSTSGQHAGLSEQEPFLLLKPHMLPITPPFLLPNPFPIWCFLCLFSSTYRLHFFTLNPEAKWSGVWVLFCFIKKVMHFVRGFSE